MRGQEERRQEKEAVKNERKTGMREGKRIKLGGKKKEGKKKRKERMNERNEGKQ